MMLSFKKKKVTSVSRTREKKMIVTLFMCPWWMLRVEHLWTPSKCRLLTAGKQLTAQSIQPPSSFPDKSLAPGLTFTDFSTELSSCSWFLWLFCLGPAWMLRPWNSSNLQGGAGRWSPQAVPPEAGKLGLKPRGAPMPACLPVNAVPVGKLDSSEGFQTWDIPQKERMPQASGKRGVGGRGGAWVQKQGTSSF